MILETVSLLPKGRTDKNGNPLVAQGPGEPINGCVIWPRASEEKDGGEVNIDGQNVRCPDNETARKIKSNDHIDIRGETHAIDEPPARFIGKAVMLKTKRVTT